MRRWRIAAIALLMLAMLGVGKNRNEALLPLTTLTTAGGDVDVAFGSPTHTRAYLYIDVSNEVASMVLTPTVRVNRPGGSFNICTFAAIIAAGSYEYLLGSPLSAGSDLDAACTFPTGQSNTVRLSPAGVAAEIDVVVSLEWLAR